MSNRRRLQKKPEVEDEGALSGSVALIAIVGGLVGAAVTYFSQTGVKNELRNECRSKDEQLKQREEEYRSINARLSQQQQECANLRREHEVKINLVNDQLRGECCICLNPFSDNSAAEMHIPRVVRCGHAIHERCFRLLRDNKCPLCRQKF